MDKDDSLSIVATKFRSILNSMAKLAISMTGA